MSDLARIEAFLEMMSAERGASPNTLDAYGRDLLDASGYMGGGLCNAEAADLSGWLQSLAKDGLAASTQARKLSSLKRFFRFLFEECDRKDDPTSKLDAPKVQRDVPDVLSREAPAAGWRRCWRNLLMRLGSTRRAFTHMPCVMPMPRTCYRAARICAVCRPCWAMLISRPHRFIPMC